MASKTIGRKGFAQVEPNHLSGIVTGQIYAQLPVATAMGDYIENGRFAKYDYAEGEVNLAGAGEWMLIYNEEKKYDERLQNHKDYVMKKTDFIDGVMVPRLIKTNVGDIFTTNTINATPEQLTLGATLKVGVKGILEPGEDDKMTWQVVKVYTMPDHQPGVKIMRIV